MPDLLPTTPTDPKISLLQRQLVLQNARFKVFKDHIVDSQSSEIEDYLVVAPHTTRPDLITGISILPVWDDRIALLRVFRHAIGRVQFEVPRGFVDAGEDPRNAALRELTEETGLRCPDEKLLTLGVCAPEGSTLAARVALFAATQCQPTDGAPEPELGLGQCEYFALPDALRMLRDMSIEDVTTALTLHRFFQLQHV